MFSDEDDVKQAQERYIRNTEGSAVDPLGLAMMKVRKEYEEYVLSLPVSEQGNPGPMQDPETGEFYFMLGYDALGDAPLA